MVLIKDGAGLRQDEPIMLIGEEDGRLEIAYIDERGLLKIKNQFQCPEKEGAIRISHILRINENYVLLVNYRRFLYLFHIPTLSIVASMDIPQPILEGANWPEEIYIKDAVILGTSHGKAKFAFAIEKMGIVIVELKDAGDKFEFKILEEHKLEEHGTIYSVGKALREGVLVFTTRERKFYIYDTITRLVIEQIIITDHNGVTNEYSKPIPVPSQAEDYPDIFLFRDGKSIFLIDLVQNESHQVVEGILAGHGLSQVAVEVVPSNYGQDTKEVRLYTTTWFQQEGHYYGRWTRDITRQLVTTKLLLP